MPKLNLKNRGLSETKKNSNCTSHLSACIEVIIIVFGICALTGDGIKNMIFPAIIVFYYYFEHAKV